MLSLGQQDVIRFLSEIESDAVERLLTNLLPTVYPVSYTHLDVYKRQVQEMKRRDTPNSPNRTHFMVELSPTCLLYTSYPFLSDDKAQMFKPEREALGSCPSCGSPVYEGKKNYYCSNKECIFTMWKNDRFFEERKVTFTPKIAAALLKSGKVNVKKLYSPKTGKTYDGTIVLADTGGKYVNYRVELPKKK